MSHWLCKISIFENFLSVISTMDNSFTQNILNPSLKLIKEDYKIKRFYFFPGLLSVIFISSPSVQGSDTRYTLKFAAALLLPNFKHTCGVPEI